LTDRGSDELLRPFVLQAVYELCRHRAGRLPFGHGRVPNHDQNPRSQRDALKAAGSGEA